MARKNVIYVVFLKCKEDWLELVFGGSFLPTTTFSKVQVHSTRLETKSALKAKTSNVNVMFSRILCLQVIS